MAGHLGLVGSALVRRLRQDSDADIIVRTHAELDLCDQSAVQSFFSAERPTQVYLAAAKVGGIIANSRYPADFLYQNLQVQCNVIRGALDFGVERLLFLGSSCIYPRLAEQPMNEGALLSGQLEPTNEPYAVAKIAGIKLCESFNRQHGTDFRAVMPTNLYGPNDNFDLENSHVVPGLMRRFHEAKQAGVSSLTIWGTGTPRREFMYVDDMADACVYLMRMNQETYGANLQPRSSHVNIGIGSDVTIRELADTMSEVVGFNGAIHFDHSKPDGMPRKLLDVSRLAEMGWRARTDLREGLIDTYAWFLKNVDRLRCS